MRVGDALRCLTQFRSKCNRTLDNLFAPIPDYEFDSARKGVFCQACNFGKGNSRLVFSLIGAPLLIRSFGRSSVEHP